MSEVASSAKPIDVELLDTGPHRESLKRRLPDWPIKTGREAVVSHPNVIADIHANTTFQMIPLD